LYLLISLLLPYRYPPLSYLLVFLSEPAWPLNNLVGANSPSLCPTISSVTNTGTCLRPSCTANVCSTNEGNMVERLDQVLTTCFLFLSFIAPSFLSHFSSSYFHFFNLRPIKSCFF